MEEEKNIRNTRQDNAIQHNQGKNHSLWAQCQIQLETKLGGCTDIRYMAKCMWTHPHTLHPCVIVKHVVPLIGCCNSLHSSGSRLSTRFWHMAAGLCSHSATRALVGSTSRPLMRACSPRPSSTQRRWMGSRPGLCTAQSSPVQLFHPKQWSWLCVPGWDCHTETGEGLPHQTAATKQSLYSDAAECARHQCLQ